MSASIKYSYTVLRYVHDTMTGEFVNVGVALHAPEVGYLSAICRTTYRRVSAAFPGLKGEHFRAVMRHVQARFEQMGERLPTSSAASGNQTLLEIARGVLPADDSSFQWGPVGVGLAADPSQMLEALFNRMVTRYDEQPPTRVRRTDDDVWRNFKRDLEQRRLLRFFEPKTIAVQDDEVRFEHAWKNGVWHCVEPVSFDMAAAETIKDKAHKLLGQIASVHETAENFRLYMLVARPDDDALMPAFESALSILQKMPCDKEIVQEDDHALLADRLASKVESHLKQQRLAT
ncbi:DUF3037 domain-containing protein [Sphaerotilaceae bacterium SBD11-9]